MDQPEPDPAALERCVEGIKYRVWWRAGSWATEMGSHMRHSVRQQAAEWYARVYFREHGRLPEGKHKVEARVGSYGDPAADIHTQCHSDEWEPVLRVTITFPAGS